MAQGIVPNPDIVNSKNISLINNNKIRKYNINIGDGVFVVQKNNFSTLSSVEKKYIKPLYEPSSLENIQILTMIKKYYI